MPAGHTGPFGHVGVFSSAVLFGKSADWEKQNKAGLDDAEARKGLKLLWFATGTDSLPHGTLATSATTPNAPPTGITPQTNTVSGAFRRAKRAGRRRATAEAVHSVVKICSLIFTTFPVPVRKFG
jgi:hypothetical protein